MTMTKVQILTEGHPPRVSLVDGTFEETVASFGDINKILSLSIRLNSKPKSTVVLNKYQLDRTIFVIEELTEN